MNERPISPNLQQAQFQGLTAAEPAKKNRRRFAMSHNNLDPSFGYIYQRIPEKRMIKHGHFVGAPGIDVLED